MAPNHRTAPSAAGDHVQTGCATGRRARAHRPGDERPRRDAMIVTVDAARECSTVRLLGDLDLATAPHVRSALPRLAGRTIVVDLSRLSFVDVAGLSALLLVRRQLEGAGRRLRFRGAQGAVRQVFEVSGLAHLLDAS